VGSSRGLGGDVEGVPGTVIKQDQVPLTLLSSGLLKFVVPERDYRERGLGILSKLYPPVTW